jgi:phosphoglycerate dehydrogenase-like enzyme
MSWKVLVTARTFPEVGQGAAELLRSHGCDVIVPRELGPLRAPELLPRLEGMDAVLASPDEFTPQVLASPQAARLKIISRWGVGYDSIDLPAATAQGIVLAYTPGFLNETVADYAFALLLSLARGVHLGHAFMARGEWEVVWGADVFGKTLGIIGCGRIGQAVARRASGFNMRLLGFDPSLSAELPALGIEPASLDQLLAESDFISLHAALTPKSRGLLGETELRKVKKGAFLINTARGALIDEKVLAQALREGWISGAALDTFSKEPLPLDHPLHGAPNLLMTPHLASFARETGERVSLAAAQAIVDAMEGRRPRWVVNEQVFASPSLRASIRP